MRVWKFSPHPQKYCTRLDSDWDILRVRLGLAPGAGATGNRKPVLFSLNPVPNSGLDGSLVSPVKDPLIVRFAEACGATSPLDLRVELAEGGVLAEGTVQQPFTLVGRDDACDVTLTDPEVNLRHTWLQVIGGRVFATDLGSRTGLRWPNGESRSGWLDTGVPVRVGPFQVHLRSAPTTRPAPIASDYDPLRTDPNLFRSRPSVSLDFRNGKRTKDSWAVNRVLTLVGRSDACKVHLHGEDISSYHCGLVLTPGGLWVVDLSGRGVVVNGERMRVAPLPQGSELWVGRFLIGCHYSIAGSDSSSGRPSAVVPISSPAGVDHAARSAVLRSSPSALPRVATPVVEDEEEVSLGGMPPYDPAAGLPSSHIMADAFRVLAGFGLSGNGPISNPILVSGSGPTPPNVPVPPARSATPEILRPSTDRSPPTDTVVVPLLRQLSELHGQMFEQFQQSLLVMMQEFGEMHREQMVALQQELSRIQELNVELTKLQADVARLTAARAGERRKELPPDQRDTVPLFALPQSTSTQGPDSGAAIREWVLERISVLQHERHSRWQKLVGYFDGTPRH